jgi:hypothetical protein
MAANMRKREDKNFKGSDTSGLSIQSLLYAFNYKWLGLGKCYYSVYGSCMHAQLKRICSLADSSVLFRELKCLYETTILNGRVQMWSIAV